MSSHSSFPLGEHFKPTPDSHGRHTKPVVPQPYTVLPNLEDIFGDDLLHEYTDRSMYKDLDKRHRCYFPGDPLRVWADLKGSFDLSTTLSSVAFGNVIPGPYVYQDKLNNHLAYGSGWIYNRDTGERITQSGDPTVAGVYNAFFEPGIDASVETYTVLQVSKNLIDDNLMVSMYADTEDEYRSLSAMDHHPTGAVLQNITGINSGPPPIRVQNYMGPDGDNFWHRDGSWRVVAVQLSWARANNVLWVNGLKYVAGIGLPVEPSFDSGAAADLLVPSESEHRLYLPDSLPQTHLAIVLGTQTDDKILSATRYLGQRYAIAVV